MSTCTIISPIRLCEDINPSNPLDVTNLHALLAGNFEGIVQYNKDNRAFEVSRVWGIFLRHRHIYMLSNIVEYLHEAHEENVGRTKP